MKIANLYKYASPILSFLLILFMVVIPSHFTGAVTGGVGVSDCPSGQLCNPIGSNDLYSFLNKLADVALKIGVPIAGLFIIWAGFLFVSAAGDKTKLEDAKKIFWYTIIGTAILLGAKLLATVLDTTIKQVTG